METRTRTTETSNFSATGNGGLVWASNCVIWPRGMREIREIHGIVFEIENFAQWKWDHDLISIRYRSKSMIFSDFFSKSFRLLAQKWGFYPSSTHLSISVFFAAWKLELKRVSWASRVRGPYKPRAEVPGIAFWKGQVAGSLQWNRSTLGFSKSGWIRISAIEMAIKWQPSDWPAIIFWFHPWIFPNHPYKTSIMSNSTSATTRITSSSRLTWTLLRCSDMLGQWHSATCGWQVSDATNTGMFLLQKEWFQDVSSRLQELWVSRWKDSSLMFWCKSHFQNLKD